jgi:hypothetical protein
MFITELKNLLQKTFIEMDEMDFEFIVEQASYMSGIERKYFFEVLERLVGIVQ